jgi:hypothetical protein
VDRTERKLATITNRVVTLKSQRISRTRLPLQAAKREAYFVARRKFVKQPRPKIFYRRVEPNELLGQSTESALALGAATCVLLVDEWSADRIDGTWIRGVSFVAAQIRSW